LGVEADDERLAAEVVGVDARELAGFQRAQRLGLAAEVIGEESADAVEGEVGAQVVGHGRVRSGQPTG